MLTLIENIYAITTHSGIQISDGTDSFDYEVFLTKLNQQAAAKKQARQSRAGHGYE